MAKTAHRGPVGSVMLGTCVFYLLQCYPNDLHTLGGGRVMVFNYLREKLLIKSQ